MQDDLISREATLKPYKGLNDEDTISVWLIRKNIEQQPSVKPPEREVLDKIKAEIEERKKNSGGEPNRDIVFNVCLQIIDKYRGESEE